MGKIAKRYQDRLKRIKANVDESRDFYKPCYEKFHDYRKFLFKSNISPEERNVLFLLKKPELEFGVLLPYFQRQMGEFATQEPFVSVAQNPESDSNMHPELIKFIEGHLRHQFYEAQKSSTLMQTIHESYSGGFSGMKIWTDYASPTSFNQVVKFGKGYDPTLMGWDPMAVQPHKGDGNYSFEIYPKRLKDAQRLYPEVDFDDLHFSRSVEGYTWSYSTDKDKYVLICDYFEKKFKRVKMHRLANGQTVSEEKYKQMLEMWDRSGTIAEPPAIVESKWADIERICRYIFMEDQVLEYEETDYPGLPHVYVPGDDIIYRESYGAPVQLLTTPYTAPAQDAQRLKNFCGQTLAAQIQNMIAHQIMIAEESLPKSPDNLRAYTNPQEAMVMIWQAYDLDNPERAMPKPDIIPRIEPSANVVNLFMGCDQLIQNIMGTYDAAMGINNNQLSGTAISKAARQSNPTTIPRLTSFMQSLTRIAQLSVAMYPRIYITPRNLPVKMKGETDTKYVRINEPNAFMLDYDDDALNVTVEAAPNFSIQRQDALDMLARLSQFIPGMQQFLGSVGLPIVFDNVEMRNADELKQKATEWLKQQEEAQQQAQQAQQQGAQQDPAMMKMQIEQGKLQQGQQELQLKMQKMQDDKVAEAAKIGLDQQRVDSERLRIMMEAGQANVDRMIKHERNQTELSHAATELALKAASQGHKHAKDLTELQHKILTEKRQEPKLE